MNSTWKKIVLALIATCASWNAFAVLDITITEGIDDARPIAIVPFTYTAGTPMAAGSVSAPPHDIAEIIRNDLERSGKFRPMKVDEMPELPHTSNELNLAAWRDKGIEAVVVGRVIETQPGLYQVAFELIDIFKAKDAPLAQMQLKNGELMQVSNAANPALLEAKQTIVQSAGYRMHAHRVADAVYQKLTGERGAFATRIAYVVVDRSDKRPYQLFVADSDDYNAIRLFDDVEPVMSPSWSRDGHQVAFASFRGGKTQIIAKDIFTGKEQVLTSFPGINGAPVWSPDGTKLALTLSYESNSYQSNPEIYVFDLQTRQSKRVTNNPAIETEPSWSPDGQWLIYTTDRWGKPQICRLHLASGQEKRMTYEGDYNAGASYSPDGKKFVLVNRSQGQFHIALQDIQSGVLQVLTDTQLDQSPSLSPNGSMVIYATLYRGQQVLAVVSSDGRFKARLAARKGEVRAPAWSPFLD